MNAMDATFTLKDVFYIGALIVSGLTAWFKMQRDKDKMRSELETLNKNIEGIVASKATTKFELHKKIEEENAKIHDRITKTQDHHAKSMETVAKDFDKINLTMSKIAIDVAKILGKLSTR